MKNNYHVAGILFLSLSFFQMDCQDEPVIPPDSPPATISIAAVNVQAYSVQLKIALSVVPQHCSVERAHSAIFTGTISQPETVITDAGLEPGSLYRYTGYLFQQGVKKDSSAAVQVTTTVPDSTLHEFTWTIDTLGTWQSSAVDVWGTSVDNVYAAGTFFNPDTATTGTSVMRWNGTQWKPEKFWEGAMFAIYGFSANDIWVGGYNGVNIVVGHWNGETWQKTELGKGQITGLWGTSSQNLYATLGSGKILNYDGSVWTTMETGTSLFLADIWGFSNNAIYACGFNNLDGSGVLLYFDGAVWNKLYERVYTSPIEPSGSATTVWGYDTAHVYINTPLKQYVGNKNGWIKIFPPTPVYMEKIRGESYKNIFFCGHFGMLVHWNGKTWYRYNQFYTYPNRNGDILNSVWSKLKHVFVVGRSETARGIVYRGKQ